MKVPLIKSKFFPKFLKDKGVKQEYSISAEMKFDAAHRLSNYEGKCRKIHGHTYRVIITVKANRLNDWGAVVDFGDLKVLLKEYVDKRYDHKLLLQIGDMRNAKISTVIPDDWIVWVDGNPTAEILARDIYKDLTPPFKQKFKDKIELVSVTVYETETNKATYKEK